MHTYVEYVFSLEDSYNCSPYLFKERFPSNMKYRGQNTGNSMWHLTGTLRQLTKLSNFTNILSVDGSPIISVTVTMAALRTY